MNSNATGASPRHIVLLLVLACLLTLPSSAFAADKGALIAVNIAGNVNDTDQKRIIESVEAALKSGETPTVMGLSASLKRIDTVAPEVAGCFTSKCLERIGSALETSVGYVVTVKEDFEFYAVEVAAYDLTTGKPLTNTTGDCEICTADEAIETVTAAAGKATLGWTYPVAAVAAVDPVKKDPDPVKKDPDPVKKDPDPVKKDLDPNVRVAFYSNPATSFIYVDGQKVGQGSYVGSLAAGPHKLKFELEGYNTAEETIDLRKGDGPTYLVIHLRSSDGGEQVVVGGRTGGAINDSNQMGLAWGFTGGGVLLTVTGAILLAIDGEPTCSGDDMTACPDVFATRAGGGIALGLGVASLTTGVLFFLWDELAGTNSEPDDSVSFGVDVLPDAKGDVGGGAVTFGGRF